MAAPPTRPRPLRPLNVSAVIASDRDPCARAVHCRTAVPIGAGSAARCFQGRLAGRRQHPSVQDFPVWILRLKSRRLRLRQCGRCRDRRQQSCRDEHLKSSHSHSPFSSRENSRRRWLLLGPLLPGCRAPRMMYALRPKKTCRESITVPRIHVVAAFCFTEVVAFLLKLPPLLRFSDFRTPL